MLTLMKRARTTLRNQFVEMAKLLLKKVVHVKAKVFSAIRHVHPTKTLKDWVFNFLSILGFE